MNHTTPSCVVLAAMATAWTAGNVSAQTDVAEFQSEEKTGVPKVLDDWTHIGDPDTGVEAVGCPATGRYDRIVGHGDDVQDG